MKWRDSNVVFDHTIIRFSTAVRFYSNDFHLNFLDRGSARK